MIGSYICYHMPKLVSVLNGQFLALLLESILVTVIVLKMRGDALVNNGCAILGMKPIFFTASLRLHAARILLRVSAPLSPLQTFRLLLIHIHWGSQYGSRVN